MGVGQQMDCTGTFDTIRLWPHRADGGLLVAELLLVSRHHVLDLQLLHDLLLLQVGVLLLSDGASQLLRVCLSQTGLQLGCQRFSEEAGWERLLMHHLNVRTGKKK